MHRPSKENVTRDFVGCKISMWHGRGMWDAIAADYHEGKHVIIYLVDHSVEVLDLNETERA